MDYSPRGHKELDMTGRLHFTSLHFTSLHFTSLHLTPGSLLGAKDTAHGRDKVSASIEPVIEMGR